MSFPPQNQSTAPLDEPLPDSVPRHRAITLPMPLLPAIEYLQPARLLNAWVLAALAAVVVIGLVGLSLGRTLRVSAFGPEISATDSLLQDRPVELNSAWAERDWTQAIAILTKLRQQQPESILVQEQLSHAYLQQGVGLRHKGFVEEAIPYFKQALQITPWQLRAKQELRLAADYLLGVKYYQEGDWARAIKAFEKVQAEDNRYNHLTDLLYSAYFNHGLALQAAGSKLLARRAWEKAITLRPDLPEPRRRIAELEFALAPNTPLVTPTAKPNEKLILVGIAEQRMWVFERGKQVFDFVVSTGEPGRETAIGEFEILDKIEVAYAATWNLDMPYWMGIYWAGPLENGIHSLPIVRHTGYKLWDGYLGQRVSYGCVILSDEDSATLFKWADVGAKVKIVPSLADWRPGE
ncbi:MAG: L,D-transpeptidase family protein [Anaerolineae bacterium]